MTCRGTWLAFKFDLVLWNIIFEQMFLEITVDSGSQNKERFHVITILHDLFAILNICSHLFAMDVVSTRQLTSLLSFC